MSHPELKFFNSLSAVLAIELTESPENIGDLDNLKATPDAKIKSVSLEAGVFTNESPPIRPLTGDELNSVAFNVSEITLVGESGDSLVHNAPNKQYFTVQDLLNAIAETERVSRNNTEWFDGVDIHHVFFEGIHQNSDRTWRVHWGS